MPASVGSVSYIVRILPEQHQLAVTMHVEGVTGDRLFVAAPTWVPGAYGFMRYGRDLFDVRAQASDGRELEIVREGWSGFAISHPPASVVITYRAAAFDPATGGLAGLVDQHQAVILGTRFLQAPAHEGPVRLRYELPENWLVHHPSGARLIAPLEWEYPTYSVLLDTPVTLGSFDRETLTVAGTDFHLVYLDDAPGFDRQRQRLTTAVERIARECLAIFGTFPFEDYTFVFSFEPRNGWGLEHANGTMIGLEPLTFLDDQAWCDAVRVIAHELFHAWNVCRLKPHPLGRPDHVNGQFPDALWVAEGFTRWYEFLLCARAGELSPRRLLANVVNYHRHLTALPAYSRVSASDSSRATFLNHHRFPGAVNASIDYYDKGLLIAFDLDAALRLHADTTLDAQFRRFFEAFSRNEKGFISEDAIRFFGERSPALRQMLEREVNRPGGLSTLLLLEALGFEVVTGERKHLGLLMKDATVADVPDDGPAARAGLTAGDEILRIGGHPFHSKVLAYETASADVVKLGVRRGSRLLELEVRPETRQETTGLRWAGTREQLERLRGWIGAVDLTPGEAIDLGPYDNFHGIQKVL